MNSLPSKPSLKNTWLEVCHSKDQNLQKFLYELGLTNKNKLKILKQPPTTSAAVLTSIETKSFNSLKP